MLCADPDRALVKAFIGHGLVEVGDVEMQVRVIRDRIASGFTRVRNHRLYDVDFLVGGRASASAELATTPSAPGPSAT
ncbi:hypothetical protein GCM10023224_36940 [Streptomonospora halophila]|uniref:Uncharacterized protein n=1 Tax=Streptomonospora halophila TaxID=427369 RepID=A0ABP9GRC9_9ACTN